MFSVAPMMGVTHRFARHLYSLLSRNAMLYTEMIAVDALAHGKRWEIANHPNVVLQIGGSNLSSLKLIGAKIEEHNYCAVNLNIGCPSDRVQSGKWGACLMKEPALVASCVRTLMDALSIPVTVKCRIGIDSDTGDGRIKEFLEKIAEAQCQEVVIHARNAILKGLSPGQNRVVPPLNYDLVYNMKQLFPQMQVIINGGIETLEDCALHLKKVDGVMLGRAVRKDPFILARVDELFYGENVKITRVEVIERFFAYADEELKRDENCLKLLIQTIVPIMRGVVGAANLRRKIGESRDSELSLESVKDQFLDLCYNSEDDWKNRESRADRDSNDLSKASHIRGVAEFVGSPRCGDLVQ